MNMGLFFNALCSCGRSDWWKQCTPTVTKTTNKHCASNEQCAYSTFCHDWFSTGLVKNFLDGHTLLFIDLIGTTSTKSHIYPINLVCNVFFLLTETSQCRQRCQQKGMSRYEKPFLYCFFWIVKSVSRQSRWFLLENTLLCLVSRA